MKKTNMNIFAFNGSACPHGNTSILIKTVFHELEHQGTRTELINPVAKKIQGLRVHHPLGIKGISEHQKDDEHG
jgi:multimeric flavodoxin WrbA